MCHWLRDDGGVIDEEIHVLVICGASGTGKTATALTSIHRNPGPELVIWGLTIRENAPCLGKM